MVVLAAGVAFDSPFLSSSFFSSFVSFFAGLVVGDAVADGLETTTGDWVAIGVETGVAATGLLGVPATLQAAEIAARAAKSVNRTDLLIGFPFLSVTYAFFPGQTRPMQRLPPRV